jgi:hypothetical protein
MTWQALQSPHDVVDKLENMPDAAEHVADAAGMEARSPGIPDRGDAFQMPCPARQRGDYVTGVIKPRVLSTRFRSDE